MLEALLGGEIRPPKKFLPDVAQLFYVLFPVLADWTPRGGKSRNTGLLGDFGLGQPLALRKIVGGKRNNTSSRVQMVYYQ